MDKKKIAKFFADTISKRELSDEQIMKLQELLFPGIGGDLKSRLRDGALDMATALMRWEKNKQSGSKEEYLGAPLTPMTDEEIEELAKML